MEIFLASHDGLNTVSVFPTLPRINIDGEALITCIFPFFFGTKYIEFNISTQDQRLAAAVLKILLLGLISAIKSLWAISVKA